MNVWTLILLYLFAAEGCKLVPFLGGTRPTRLLDRSQARFSESSRFPCSRRQSLWIVALNCWLRQVEGSGSLSPLRRPDQERRGRMTCGGTQCRTRRNKPG
jgi:hypothetical protein